MKRVKVKVHDKAKMPQYEWVRLNKEVNQILKHLRTHSINQSPNGVFCKGLMGHGTPTRWRFNFPSESIMMETACPMLKAVSIKLVELFKRFTQFRSQWRLVITLPFKSSQFCFSPFTCMDKNRGSPIKPSKRSPTASGIK